ncbi:hypothetical protein GGC63_000435 [Paenibacillus sp. OAS669]|nr:hypothetical protein [Paenibacillus sp. OAS669]
MSTEGSALKGTVYGILFTLPIWGAIAWIVFECLD